MTANRFILWGLLLLSFSTQCLAQAENFFTSPAGATLSITLKGPWSAIARDTSKDPQATAATLTMTGTETLNIKVKPRGKSRRRSDFCRFPPLWLDLPKARLNNTPFAGQNKLKLVTHCSRLGSKSGKASDQLWSEYLAYQIYNLVTDNSFRTRAVDIRYIGLDGVERGHHPGFLIEHKKSLAERLDLKPFNGTKIQIASLEPNNAALVALFQYFIGGVDYSQIRGPEGDNCCHNLTPMTASDGRLVGVPYDFDATGFVDPPYGAPLPHLRITSYTQRLYRGFCSYKSSNAQALQLFLAAKPQIEELISNFPEISKARRKKLLRFIEGFYKKLPEQSKGVARLNKICR